ncbi:hypothetical protein D3C72_1986780 [compost metagenome]
MQAGARLGQHQALDERLRRGRAAAPLAHLDHAHAVCRMREDGWIDEVVDQHHVGPRDGFHRLEGQQVRVAGTGADQGHATTLRHDALSNQKKWPMANDAAYASGALPSHTTPSHRVELRIGDAGNGVAVISAAWRYRSMRLTWRATAR